MNKKKCVKYLNRKHITTLPGGNRYGHNEAASFLGLTPGTLAKWRSVGHPFIPYFKIGKKVIYIEDDLCAYLAQRRVDLES